MTVPLFLKSLEDTGFSTWLRETNSVFVFYFILLFHTFGLALLVGANAVVDLRILGVVRELPLAPMRRFFSIMWTGFGINVVTGILLVIAYPTKALTNPVFYVKLTLIALAVIVMQKTYTHVFAGMGESDATEAAFVGGFPGPSGIALERAAAVTGGMAGVALTGAAEAPPITLERASETGTSGDEESERQTSENMKVGRRLAIWSLILWTAAITAGRLLAYTYTYLLYGHPPVGR